MRTGLARVLEGEFTHVLLLDGDLQHLPPEAASLLAEAESQRRRRSCSASGASERDSMPASRYHANRIGSRVLSWFVGVPVQDTQCGFRVFRVDALRPPALTRQRL